jgi:hypothetical protein
MELERVDVPPPLPAPYLNAADQLADALAYDTKESLSDSELDASPALRLQMQAAVLEIKRSIRRWRQAYELKHGVVIIPEIPLEP